MRFSPFHMVFYRPLSNWLTLAWLTALTINIFFYWPGGLFFLNDDFIHVPLSEQAVFGQQHSIRIVNDFSLYLDTLLFGRNPAGFHLTNLLIHAANVWLLLITTGPFFKAAGIPVKRWTPHVVSLFFAVYPFHSEAVFWLIARTGSLSTLFFLLALRLHLMRNSLALVSGSIAFILGLFTYESILFYPAVWLALWMVSRLRQHASSVTRYQAGLFFTGLFILAGYFAVRLFWLGAATDHYESGALLSGQLQILAGNYYRLAARLVTPPLHGTYWFIFISMVLLGMLAFFTAQMLKKIPKASAAMVMLSALVCLSLLPYISLGIDTHGVESERYLYLPSSLVALWLGAFLSYQPPSRKRAGLLALLYLIFSGFYLYRSSQAFRGASAFAQQVTDLIQKQCVAGGSIRLFNMPGENGGAVLFRTGVPEAVRWLAPDCRPSAIASEVTDLNPYLTLPAKTAVMQAKDRTAFALQAGVPLAKLDHGDLLVCFDGKTIWWTR